MLLTEEEAKTKTCAIAGCTRSMDKRASKGMCQYHYKRALAGRRIEGPDYKYLKICSVVECDEPVTQEGGKGMCPLHYSRSRRGKKPMDAPRLIRGCGWVSSHGYRYFGKTAEHRLVAHEALGREILRGEVVHHLDGNKQNNHPSNLMVMDNGAHARARAALGGSHE